MTTDKTAEIFKITPNALAVMRCRGLGPRYVKINKRAVRYYPSDVEEWIRERFVDTTDSVAVEARGKVMRQQKKRQARGQPEPPLQSKLSPRRKR